MKTKITLLLLLIGLPILTLLGSEAFAQTVSGTVTTTGCSGGGTITASSTGLGATPQYQLLKDGVVLLPDASNTAVYTNNPIFNGLVSGSYTLKARADAIGTIYTSAVITVNNGYTAMTVVTPTATTPCAAGNVALTTTVTGGKANYVYSIKNTVTNVVHETSAATSATTHTFAALPVGTYLVSVTDNCGSTITGAASISTSTVSINDIAPSITYPTRGANCAAPMFLSVESGFRYLSNSQNMSAADRALFTWKYKYLGQLYGQDTNADGFPDIGGAGFTIPPTGATQKLPLIATRAGVVADISNMKVVLYDLCGNSKEFSVTDYNKTISSLYITNCNGIANISSRINAGLDCLPLTLTFTNAANPVDEHTHTITSYLEVFSLPLTLGATYNITYVDNEGFTTGLYTPASSTRVMPSTSSLAVTQNFFGTQQNLNVLNYGILRLAVSPFQVGETVSYTVTSSSNPLVPVGYTNTAVLDGNGYSILKKVNATDPDNFWPKGNYTLAVTAGCGTKSANFVVEGYTASLTAGTTTPICGGFNYVMNGNFDVQSAYQVIVVSGPASVGQVRDLASTTASLPFDGLTYGTYVFGLRLKGSTVNVLTETVTYSAANAITIDKSNTGGFVCTAGSNTGTLTISATSNSPAPGNALTYALSTDGGLTYGAYQPGNTFSGLTNGTYSFKVKDACGNEVTNTAQIGVAAAPTASANGVSSVATICESATGTIQLDVDVLGASSYLWTGPGITAANQGLKNPQVNTNALAVGINNYTVTVTLGAPCNSSSIANLVINITAKPSLVVTNPTAVCAAGTVDLTAAEVTAGSEAGLVLSYFSDAEGTLALANPNAIAASGTYYIKALNSTTTCEDIKPVVVTINTAPVAPTITGVITQPDCTTATGSVTLGNLPASGTWTLTRNPGAVSFTGTGTSTTITGLGVGNYTYTVTNAAGCTSIIPLAVNINPQPTTATLTLTSAVATTGQIININTPIATIQYTTGGGATGVTVTGLPAGVTHTYNAGTGLVEITGSPTVSGPFNYSISTTGGCTAASLTGTITVNGAATIVLTSAAGSNVQSFCMGAALTPNMVFTTTNTTGVTISAGALPAGVTGVFDAGTQTYTISGTATATGLFTFELTANGAGGSSAALTGNSITVKPNSTIVLASGNGQTPCINSAITNIVFNLTNATGASVTTGTLPAGLTGVFDLAAQTFTISGTPTAAAALATYTVTATGECAAVTSDFTLTVNALPVVPTIATTAATCDAAGTATISNYSAANTYTFLPAGPVVGAGGVVTGLTPGTSYTVTANNGSCTSAASAGFSIADMLPAAVAPTVTTTAATCAAAGTATISNYSAGNTYTFSPSGPSVGAGGVITGLTPGTTYTVTASNGNCTSATSAGFSIQSMLPLPIATISYVPNEYQTMGTAMVIQTGQTGGTYSASPIGLSINANTGEIDLGASTPNQSYTVTYTFSNGSCSNTATTTVKINSKPATIAYANAAYCATGTANVIRTGATGGTYSASPQGLSINASTGEVNLATSKAGAYTITYTYQDGSITASTTTTITVNALPVVAITTDIANGNSIPLGDVATLTATGGVSYSWTGDDIQSGQNTATIKVRPKLATTYTVTVTSESGCTTTMQFTINTVGVVSIGKIVPNNVITPNGDGKNDVWVVKNLDFFPKHTVMIYDRAGRKLYTAKNYKNDWDGTYNGQPLAEGAYVYVIDSGEGTGVLKGTINIIRDKR